MNYTGKQNFEIELNWTSATISVEIDFDKTFKSHPEADETYTTMDSIKMMVEFWAGWENDLKEHDGDYVRLFLKNLAKEAFRVGFYDDWNEYGIKNYFKEAEGWSNMDGTHGILITNFDNIEIEFEDLIIS